MSVPYCPCTCASVGLGSGIVQKYFSLTCKQVVGGTGCLNGCKYRKRLLKAVKLYTMVYSLSTSEFSSLEVWKSYATKSYFNQKGRKFVPLAC